MATRGKPFKKGGDPRRQNGREKGVPNKVTRAVKDFFVEITSDPDVQDAFKDVILARDKSTAVAFLGAAAHVIGKPKETVQVDTTPNMAKLIVMALQAAAAEREGKGVKGG